MELNQKLLDIALDEYANLEGPGGLNNPDVIKYFHDTGRQWVDNDSTPWCDAFMDWVVRKAGGKMTPGLLAREWLDEGEKVTTPKKGDLTIFWRTSKDSSFGHVALFIREKDGHIWVLGGNQSDMVQISAYPKSRLLGYRRLSI